MDSTDQSDRAVKIGLLSVIALMSWPVWLAVIAGKRSFTWDVAASALVPLALTLMVPAFAYRLPLRLAHAYHGALHSLGELLHGGTHRHA